MSPDTSRGVLRKAVRDRHGIVERWEALRNGLPRFFTGYPCNRGYVSERETKTGKCLACSEADAKQQARGRGRFPKYSIEEWQVHKMHKEQEGLCAICDDPIALKSEENQYKRTAHIDHCHDTGKVRGLLCQKCNIGIGMFCDDVDKLGRAIAYLQDSCNE
ncbi:endonuclease VII domain-containing protein [Microvirga sp. Mcv34]|uniref:endonuclease VII domain-containing protein n=1 Tax=Microvirga sp. Mcv34 TaxID=2926016 RepID=UPI0021C8D363|nr:endonuclease VII domain-containing protein [Microvirga sp. Mcv34]